MRCSVYVINRAQDTARLAAFSESTRPYNIDYEVIPAIDGHAPGFPSSEQRALAGPKFWGGDRIKPGALACFLSHRAAWHRLVGSQVDAALICEDDVELTESVDRALSQLGESNVLFCNQRLASWAGVDAQGKNRQSISEVCAALAARGGVAQIPGLRPAPGGDCYLLTQSAARRLLTLTERDGVVCGVDWAILWYGLDAKTVPPDGIIPELTTLSAQLRPETAPLTVTVLTRPISRQTGVHPSTLRHEITIPLRDR